MVSVTRNDDNTVREDPQTGKQRDTESGQFVAEHDETDFVSVIEELWPDEFPTTKRVADEVGISRRGAYDYLIQLEDDGRIKSRKSGASKVWMPAKTDDD